MKKKEEKFQKSNQLTENCASPDWKRRRIHSRTLKNGVEMAVVQKASQKEIEGRKTPGKWKGEIMFFGDRYLTSGIEATIPKVIQLYLWRLVEELCTDDSINTDYLQVFELTPLKNNKLKIIHRQEQPVYKKEHLVNLGIKTSQKIFVIDSKEYSTMLLAREY